MVNTRVANLSLKFKFPVTFALNFKVFQLKALKLFQFSGRVNSRQEFWLQLFSRRVDWFDPTFKSIQALWPKVQVNSSQGIISVLILGSGWVKVEKIRSHWLHFLAGNDSLHRILGCFNFFQSLFELIWPRLTPTFNALVRSLNAVWLYVWLRY